jgi:ankyrin repeat protein
LDAGANVNRADDHGLTPIFLAGLTFCKSIVAVLLHYGADPHIFIDMPYCCPVAFDPIASRDIIDLLEDYGYTITVIQRCYVSGKIPWCALKHIRNE